MSKTRSCAFLIAVCSAQLAAAAGNCIVVTRSGQELKGTKLTAAADGTLKLALGQRGVQTFPPGSYRSAYVPQPRQVTALVRAARAGRHSEVLERAGPLYASYRYLGWGDLVCLIQGEALLAQQDAAGARAAFERGLQCPGPRQIALQKGLVQALIEMGNAEAAEARLEGFASGQDESALAFVFNARGKLAAARGEPRQAVLEYLKTVLLFDPQEVPAEWQEAKSRTMELLKQMQDPRWQEIAKIK